ncbi:TIGR03617 family F420-dependent LLM class oxidoreductase [Pseudonocardia xishanensis]|uniref:LLM class F420-dependent oxidoreductase n=1 Tax=Pseudonocardia xishanensis TaxID=630995 RepID=A0ABP8RHU8_9PSEU
MKIDTFLADGLAVAPAQARRAEEIGFDAVWTGEVAHDPLLPLAAAAAATSQIQLGTAITLAFARNPMSVAYQAWDLAQASQGRFILGLGTQVKAHITRRFSMPWGKPVAQMREYVEALHAIFAAWQNGNELAYEGEYYRHSLMTPVFDPGPLPEGQRPGVALAAVGRAMTRLAGELCDGVFLHPFTHARYVDETTLPALEEGAASRGRPQRPWIFSYMFLVVGDDDRQQAVSEAQIRKQLAFYASTPAYTEVLRGIGRDDLQPKLLPLSKEGRWDEMADLIDAETLDHFVLRGRLEELPGKIARRYHGRADRVASYYALPEYEPERLSEFVKSVHTATDALSGGQR